MYGNASKSPLEKFLFTTLKHQSQEDDKVFFFYENVNGRFKLALLNCEPDPPDRKWQDQEKTHDPENGENIKMMYNIGYDHAERIRKAVFNKSGTDNIKLSHLIK